MFIKNSFNKAGFSLIECLVSLAVLMSCLLLFQPALRVLIQVKEKYTHQTELEFQVGKIQLENTIKELVLIRCEESKLVFEDRRRSDEIDRITIEHYQQMIRKKPGHHPLMLSVKSVKFYEFDEAIEVEVIMIDEEKYVFLLFPPKE